MNLQCNALPIDFKLLIYAIALIEDGEDLLWYILDIELVKVFCKCIFDFITM